ncbi:hypothetical protein LPC08_24110 [Roseomonas sp. OT10]|uniref:hypothetical protein n=1 Tax=Roseomonas cutis TaxID=2897332 RepID=UPI001E39CA98|nr:hypothetical protein [Roseomonas sp. OT10]UFN49035.1 hypothetical protein LPC08_24110 [Roseomonas sp. OT10]
MSRIPALAAALALSLGAALPAMADVLDQSNSASATGNPFVTMMAVTQNGYGASPASGNSVSARGDALRYAGTVTPNRFGATPSDWSNSAAPLKGPAGRTAQLRG